MRSLTIILLSTLVVLVIYSCRSSVKSSENYRSVDVAAAKAIITAEPDVVLLDVRTPEEVAAGKIDGALTIDVLDDTFGSKIAKLDKEKPYLVYCKSGGRSVKASKIMLEQGFTDVINMEGGYTAWK